MTQDTIQKRTA